MARSITPEEYLLAKEALSLALQSGAAKARVTLTKSVTDLVGTRDGAIDKVTHSFDRSLSLALFVEGRFGTFSTNRLESGALREFVASAVAMTRTLVPDPARDLPDPERTARGHSDFGLYDPSIDSVTEEDRIRAALDAVLNREGLEAKVVSEEAEYSDSSSETLVLDSQGLDCLEKETSFDMGCEITVEDAGGDKFASYWWDASPRREGLDSASCAATAYRRAADQIGPSPIGSVKTNLVVDSECASKLINPILTALSGYSLQHHNSFLLDSLGKKVFDDNVTLLDRPHEYGRPGCRMTDNEGVRTEDADIIRDGVISRYFINTYISRKTGLSPTVEDASRPVLVPTGGCKTLSELLSLTGEGILVTGFNGGNNNSSTGDFSYGVDGYVFRDGKIVHPVREVLITGNFLTLWNNLIATAEDARPCMSKVIPSLAFRDVDFSA